MTERCQVTGNPLGTDTWSIPCQCDHCKAYRLGRNQAREAALEEAALACETMSKEIVCPEECATAIRALIAKPESEEQLK